MKLKDAWKRRNKLYAEGNCYAADWYWRGVVDAVYGPETEIDFDLVVVGGKAAYNTCTVQGITYGNETHNDIMKDLVNEE